MISISITNRVGTMSSCKANRRLIFVQCDASHRFYDLSQYSALPVDGLGFHEKKLLPRNGVSSSKQTSGVLERQFLVLMRPLF